MGAFTGWGVLSGTLPNGGTFTTPAGETTQVNAIVALQAIETAALVLEVAVSTSLTAPVTGSAPGMDGPIKAALSASYSAVTASIY